MEKIVPAPKTPPGAEDRAGKAQNVQVGAPGKQDYETPDEFFHLCDREFNFQWDLAAHQDNKKCPLYLGPGSPYGEDSLSWSWYQNGGFLWLNPPFADIKPWARKCLEESEKGARVVMLTLASTGANWFRDYCWNRCDIRFLNGRLKFKGATGPFPKDLALYVFDAKQIGGVGIWDWRTGLSAKRSLERSERVPSPIPSLFHTPAPLEAP